LAIGHKNNLREYNFVYKALLYDFMSEPKSYINKKKFSYTNQQKQTSLSLVG